ncbi:uncharacterized protein LOC135211612 [Macrobrachium nipponense]|uniref:uncharacterized protein LOC135211612 n=1 Tax=Macrobrachium nipponense TaxID=159736 RepID=UPI0030C8CB2F
MKVLVTFLAALTAAAECSLLPTYSLPAPGPTPIHDGGGHNIGASCPHGQIHHDGRCVTPEVIRNVYVYNVPHIPQPPGPTPHVPPPKVEHNIVFVRLPEEQGEAEPIVVPPPQQKNVVYVLKKESVNNGPDLIHVPAPPKSNPEVYFVNIGQGENPLLPTGEDLQSALANSAGELTAQVLGGGGSSGSHGHAIGTIDGSPLDTPSVLYRAP